MYSVEALFSPLTLKLEPHLDLNRCLPVRESLLGGITQQGETLNNRKRSLLIKTLILY